jgi:CheY-like chemotaxis protein
VTATAEKALMKVLVVDDSDLNRKMICKALAATKEFLCEQAVDGSKAVEMVRPHLADDCNNGRLYDIILMDYQMPVMDGPTAIAEIRRLGYDGIILGLTGNALLSDRDNMLKAGANGVLLKPLNVELFRDTLRVLSTKK